MTKIEKDKPLPKHTKFNYSECYAKIVLEDFFSYNLLLDDKPDLQDMQNNIGIEVTIAEKKKTLEAENLISRLLNNDGDIPEKTIKYVKQCGSKYENGFLISSGVDNFELINKRIMCKIKKLKSGGYKKLNEYQLFVFSSIYAIDFMLEAELQFLLKENISHFFSKIYVLVPKSMFCFDLEENEYKIISIDYNRQFYYAQKARDMVEKGELNDKH